MARDVIGRDEDGVAFDSGKPVHGAPLMFGTREKIDEDEWDRPPGGLTVQFGLNEEIDSYYERVTAHGTDVMRPIAGRSWGQRSFQIHDPFGYHLGFAMNLEDNGTLAAD